MGINSTLYTAVTGLNAASFGISVASNNIANANVEGYSRRTITFSSAGYRDTGVGYIGSGVKIDGINRVKDRFLEDQIRYENARMQTSEVQVDTLDFIETVVNEPNDSALSARMLEMFNSFDSLASDPSSAPRIESAIQKTQIFADSVNEIAKGINVAITDNNTLETSYLSKAETIITELNELNTRIEELSTSGTTPNELMDVRDGYLNELSDYAELEITRLDNNVVEVSVKTSGGDQQVVGSTPVSFTAIKDTLTEGKIKGINDANTTLTSYLSSIDSFVETLATDMNSIHNTSGGGALFTFTAGSAASTIEVASDVLNGTRRLNVGDVANPGDGTLASQFADFSTSAMSNGKIPQEEYNEFLVTLGTDIGNIQNKVTSRMAVLDQLEIKRESLSGVSIDEETVDLMTFQQSYEANAKVMNVVQEMMDTLLGIFR